MPGGGSVLEPDPTVLKQPYPRVTRANAIRTSGGTAEHVMASFATVCSGYVVLRMAIWQSSGSFSSAMRAAI